MKSKKIALVGLGYWGPKYLRVFDMCQQAQVKYCVDINQDTIKSVQKEYPDPVYLQDMAEALEDPEVSAVVLATPASSHFHQAVKILNKGKSVLIEKPTTLELAETMQLHEHARRNKLSLYTGYTYLHHPGIKWIKKNILNYGQLLSFNSSRSNLGPVRSDCSAIHDLATHDLSILQYLISGLSVSHASFFTNGSALVELCRSDSYGKASGFVYASWQEPEKKRCLRLNFEDHMIEFDDTKSQCVKVYCLSEGSCFVPDVQGTEPLLAQVQDFLNALEEGSGSIGRSVFDQDIAQLHFEAHYFQEK